jgi:hypothetical protein
MIQVAAAINSFASAEMQANFVPLFRTALELARDEPELELKENQHLDPKKIFELLEQISVDILAPILEHEATDKESREISRDLRAVPDELRSYLNKGTKDYFEAIEELTPLIDAAKAKLLEGRKPGAAETKEDHRARLLLEKLPLWKMIRIAKAIDIIDGDEGKKPSYAMARRAMKRAAEISPNAVFINGCNDGLGSVLKEAADSNCVAWYV